MPVTNQGPDEWFARVTKFVLGQGGIVWEDTETVLRSRADGTNWTVADDIPNRDEEITYYNLSWRGGYDADNDPTYKKPKHEITWRGEYARNYHDGHPIPRRNGFGYNGTHYATPGGQVLGGCIFVPTTGVDSQDEMIFICTSNYTLYSKRLADIGVAGGWNALGQIPLGNTDIGNFAQFRSIFFSPDGSKAARVGNNWTTAQTEDDVQESDFTEYTMLADGSQLSQTTYNTYGPWGVDLTGTTGIGGSGTMAMTNTSDRPILGADYHPDGTLKTFAVSSWDVQGSWVSLEQAAQTVIVNQDIDLNFDGFVYRHANYDMNAATIAANSTINVDFSEVHYVDLRYGTLVYSTFDQVEPLVTLGSAEWVRRVRIRHQSENRTIFTYTGSGATPRIVSTVSTGYNGALAGKNMLDGTNPQDPEPFVLQKPWGDGGWPHTDDYYQADFIGGGEDITAVFGLNLYLAERTRPSDDDPVNDNNTTKHWAVENPKGGLIICLPENDSVGGNDPDDLVFYMTGGQDLTTLLATVGITVTIDRDDGHSFGHALK